MISFLSLRTDYVFCLQQRVTKPLNSIIHIFKYYVDAFLKYVQGVQKELCFFSILPPLPCKLWTGIGRSENDFPVEIVHSHYVLYYDGY